MNNYTVEFYIRKFWKIPEEKWCIGNYTNHNDSKRCALGHCRIDPYESSREAMELGLLCFWMLDSIADINDGKNSKFKQRTPKRRVLAALFKIRRLQGRKVRRIKHINVKLPDYADI